MTDDLKAPERIWLDWPGANKGDPVFDEPPEHYLQAGQTKYVRADVHAAQIADLQRQLAEAREALSRSKRLRDQYREALDAERNHSNPARILSALKGTSC